MTFHWQLLVGDEVRDTSPAFDTAIEAAQDAIRRFDPQRIMAGTLVRAPYQFKDGTVIRVIQGRVAADWTPQEVV